MSVERPQYKVLVELFPHQKSAVAKLVKRRNCLYLGKAGSGKSLSTLAAFFHNYNKGYLDTMLVMTPLNAYVKGVWKKDIDKNTNCKAIDIEELFKKTGGDYEKVQMWVQRYPIVYMKHTHLYVYDRLISDLQKMSRCCVVLDEGHCMKNFKSRLRVHFNMLINNYAALYCLTASPVSKDMKDFYSLMQLVKPWFLGSFESFKQMYCKVTQQVIGRNGMRGLKKVDIISGVSNPELLQRKIEPYVISQDSLMTPHYHYYSYELSKREASIYKKLGKGAFASRFEEDMSAEDWFKRVMGEQDQDDVYLVKDNQRHSSRFLYLQFAADGVISDNGEIGNIVGTKLYEVLNICRSIADKGQSALLYFDYFASLRAFQHMLQTSGINCKILENSGERKFSENELNAGLVKIKPHFILTTKAGSASESLYYINNVIYVHVPTTPETMTQMTGRICRANTLFPGDLHVYLPKSETIDLYKLCVVSHKAAQAEVVAKEETNIPPDYKKVYSSEDSIKMLKKFLLWDKRDVNTVLVDESI